MSQDVGLNKFSIPESVSHVEVASLNYDQWILTIAIRFYAKSNQGVLGMAHVIFENFEGFRLLDEGAMLNFAWQADRASQCYVHRVQVGGWLEMEHKAGNMHLSENAKEYLIVTLNECVSVIAYEDPILVGG